MTKTNFVQQVTELLRNESIKKPISVPKHTFHISDDDGNSKDFTVKQVDKEVYFTVKDVDRIINASIAVMKGALKRGEPVKFPGIGSIALKYRKPRKTKLPNCDEVIEVAGRYVPKFSFGQQLRQCARVYEASLKEEDFYMEHMHDTDYEEGE